MYFSKSIFYGEKFLQENYQLSKSEEQIYFWYSLALLNSNQKEKALEIANRISVSNIEIDSLKAKIQFPKTKQFSKKRIIPKKCILTIRKFYTAINIRNKQTNY